MPLPPRQNIAGIEEGRHGGIDYAELESLGIDPEKIFDFSVSSNPRGIPTGIRPLVKSTRLSRYPDSQCLKLRRMIAGKTGLSVDNILAGGGSTELIRLAAMAYLDESDMALIIEPTYGEYRLACQIAGACVISYRLSPQNDFEFDVDNTLEIINDTRPKAIFICNPNNPTGGYLGQDSFGRILQAAADSLVVLDEAYASFARRRWPATELIDAGNLLILRSLTKDYALAGLRLGYAVAAEGIIKTLRRICPPWNVNAVAQHAGIVALQQEKYLKASRELVRDGQAYLAGGLEKLGFRCLPSEANFFLVQVGDAAETRHSLLQRGILVRDCTSFGLPEYIRVAPRTMKKNRKLLAAMREISEH